MQKSNDLPLQDGSTSDIDLVDDNTEAKFSLEIIQLYEE